MDFLTGLGVEVVGLLLIGAGFLAGWKVRDAREPSTASPEEEEKRRAEEEEAAFQKMMNYSTETAYGLNKRKGIDA